MKYKHVKGTVLEYLVFTLLKQLCFLFSAYKMFLQVSNNTILQNDKFLKVVNILLDSKKLAQRTSFLYKYSSQTE